MPPTVTLTTLLAVRFWTRVNPSVSHLGTATPWDPRDFDPVLSEAAFPTVRETTATATVVAKAHRPDRSSRRRPIVFSSGCGD
jgi:hypothetical protein